jgi:hypothetical protein
MTKDKVRDLILRIEKKTHQSLTPDVQQQIHTEIRNLMLPIEKERDAFRLMYERERDDYFELKQNWYRLKNMYEGDKA